MTQEQGRRDNKGKLSWILLPFDALEEVVKVYNWACRDKKPLPYPPRNWEKGLSYSDTVDSLMRHIKKWYQDRETFDDGPVEQGHSHLRHTAHMVWNTIALLAMELRGIGVDDRPIVEKQWVGDTGVQTRGKTVVEEGRIAQRLPEDMRDCPAVGHAIKIGSAFIWRGSITDLVTDIKSTLTPEEQTKFVRDFISRKR